MRKSLYKRPANYLFTTEQAGTCDNTRIMSGLPKRRPVSTGHVHCRGNSDGGLKYILPYMHSPFHWINIIEHLLLCTELWEK